MLCLLLMLATIAASVQIAVAANSIEPGQAQGINPFSTPMMVPYGTPSVPASSWADIQAAIASAVGSIDIHVMNDITADSAAITIPAGLSVYLRSNPASSNIYSIFQDNINERHFAVDGAELSIGDIQLTRNTLSGNGLPSGGIQVTNDGYLKLFAGSLINGNEAEFGGGISVESGSLEMQGGIISGNTTFAHHGGGVYLSNGNFIMNSGEISGNTSFEMGGGVYIANNSTFTLQEGIISGNEATTCSGGGVAVSESSFIMSGGTISDNTAVSLHGGGIFNTAGGSVNISGGTITSNTTLQMHGGGIYNDEGSSLTISGGIIINNTAPNGFGGGIYTLSYDDLTIDSNTLFIGNTASSSHDWYLSPSFPGTPAGNVPSGESGWALGGSITNIQWHSTSIAGAHLLNNYDINFSGAPIRYQVLNFNPNGGSFADTALSHIQADGQLQWRWISQVADTGVEDPPPTYSLAFDAAGNLQNLALPHPTRTNYNFGGWFDSEMSANGTTQEGRVTDTDAVSDDIHRTLYARWIPITTEPPPPEPPPTIEPPAPEPPPIEPTTPEVPPTEPPSNEPPPKKGVEEEDPPNRPDGNGPQTGDDSNFFLWNVLALLCAVVALLSGGGLISSSAVAKKKGRGDAVHALPLVSLPYFLAPYLRS